MPNTNVNILMSAQEAGMASAWLKARRNVGAYEQSLVRAGNTGRQAGGKIAKGVDNVIPSLSRAALGFIGIGSAVQGIATAAALVRAEWEQLKGVQKASAERHISRGQQIAALRGSLPPDSNMTADELADFASSIPSRLTDVEKLRVIGSGIGFGIQGAGEQGVRSRAEMNAEVLRQMGNEYANNIDVLTTIGEAATAAKIVMPDKSNAELVSQLRSALQASPAGTENVKQFGENIVPAALRLVSTRGFTFRESLKELIGPQFRSLDVEGASTRTTQEEQVEDIFKNLTEQMLKAQQEGRHNEANAVKAVLNKGPKMREFIVNAQDGIGVTVRQILNGIMDEQLVALSEKTGVPLEDLRSDLGIDKNKNLDETSRGRAKSKVAAREGIQAKGFAEGPSQTKSLIKQVGDVILEGDAAVADAERRIREGLQSTQERAFHIDTALKHGEEQLKTSHMAAREQEVATIERLYPLLGEGAAKKKLDAMVMRMTSGDMPTDDILKRQIFNLERLKEKHKKAAVAAESERAPFTERSAIRAFEIATDPMLVRRSAQWLGLIRGKAVTDRPILAEDERHKVDILEYEIKKLQSLLATKLDTLIEVQRQPVDIGNPKDLQPTSPPTSAAAGASKDKQPAEF